MYILEAPASYRAPTKHISKNVARDISYNPLIMKPNQVGISLQNAYAYAIFWVPKYRA